jgi:hypothetical protein
MFILSISVTISTYVIRNELKIILEILEQPDNSGWEKCFRSVILCFNINSSFE